MDILYEDRKCQSKGCLSIQLFYVIEGQRHDIIKPTIMYFFFL